jgi:hypothetical protein
MISLELAKKLKDAGLKWEPKEGDWYIIFGDEEQFLEVCGTELHRTDRCIDSVKRLYRIAPGELCFIPSLSQLLAEIEKRGYEWDLEFDIGGCHKYSCTISSDTHYEFMPADTPEETAAQALLWILERGQGDD